MDEAISQVVAICDTTPERAAQYVQLADGDANQAVMLFLENGGADLSGGQTHNPPVQETSRSGNANNPIAIDDDENISDDNDPEITGFRKVNTSSQPQTGAAAHTDDDEAMARRLQEEMYGGAAEEEVRAPIARQAETLLGPGAEAPGYSMFGNTGMTDPAIQARMQAFQTRRGTGFRAPGIFNQQQPTSHIWQGEERSALSEATGGASDGSARNGMLARLFQPPWDLMYKGSWEDARDEGKEQKKWLLVNIQDASIFDCQVLNRDIWKNESVADSVKENFVFLQYSKDDPRADQYVQYYFHDHDVPDAYPHVAIVDPRTGEQIKLWSRSMPKAPDFLMQLHEFLDRYSLEIGARNPVAKRRPEVKKKTLDQMTEEEQLEQALQASMAGQDQSLKPPSSEDPDELTRSVGDLRSATADNDKSDIMSTDPIESSTTTTPFAQIPADHPHAEPAPGPNITRVQLRHPAGRIVRRFAVSDPVQRIYEFLKAEPLEGREGKEFELVAMGKNLMEGRNQTIEEAGLKNGTIMVEFIDE